ncbi:sensor histidine kinase [Paenibacillus sp. LHD-117]|uniref:sensor histidine kinase n=1 Tax=Paenibacillus sp. LHD-117 TaxID=3071412 RepID=UPI0027DF564D|nr:sensor histidine kinase [Paenibacillus sp. LHD-117]MDQ6422984.1 sensor histidine kinase [Paenibacillus sp. LHD-117]
MIRGIQNRFVHFSHVMIKALRSTRIFQRLVVAFFVLIILPSLFITFFTYNKYVNEIETNMEKFLSLLVQNVNVQITDKLNSFERAAVQIYSDSAIISALRYASMEDRLAVGRKLNSVAMNNGYIASLQVVTPTDQYTMIDSYGERSGGYIRDLKRFRESEFYTAAMEQHGYPVWFDTSRVTDLFYKSETIKYGMTDLITMTQAVYDMETHDFVGVLVLNIKVGVLTDSLKSYAFYGSGNTFLTGPNGAIMGINLNISEPNFSTARDIVPLIASNREGVYNGKMDGTRVFIVYKQVPYTDLSVVHIVDKDKLLQPAYNIRNLCLSIVAVLIMLSIIVAYWTTISISQPLNKLMRAMGAFPSNEFNVSYTPSGQDEITLLGNQFINMADHTKTLIDQIYVSEIKQKTLELNQATAELNVLQMQINPHFLYNTLDIIRWEAMYEAGGESKATRMIDDFCKLMRITINKGEEVIPIEMELTHALTYIDVINFRHRAPISLTIDFDLNTKSFYIPRLTIQPLIENAVIHAFHEVGAEARISITGTMEHSIVLIRVTDNGAGIQPGRLTELKDSLLSDNSPQGSIALYNVNQRLKLLYGESCGLDITSELGVGTTALIRLPAIEK